MRKVHKLQFSKEKKGESMKEKSLFTFGFVCLEKQQVPLNLHCELQKAITQCVLVGGGQYQH